MWEEAKTNDLIRDLKVTTFHNHWFQMEKPNNDSNGELYFGNWPHRSDDRDYSHPDSIHHLYLAFRVYKGTPNHDVSQF